jgi:hypothetical protein
MDRPQGENRSMIAAARRLRRSWPDCLPLLFVLAVILHSTPTGAEGSSYVGSIKDFEPTDIEIKIMRNGGWERIGAGAPIKIGESISIRDWCRKHDVSSHVAINTATGEVRLDCGKDGRDIIELTERGFVIPQIPQSPSYGTVPTITSQVYHYQIGRFAAAPAAPPPEAAAGGSVYFTDYLAGTWSVIDPRNGSHFATFEFGPSGQLRARPGQSTISNPRTSAPNEWRYENDALELLYVVPGESRADEALVGTTQIISPTEFQLTVRDGYYGSAKQNTRLDFKRQ